MRGAWVFVCGPSGAGKDSVIAWARQQLAGNTEVIFSQRLMTRPTPAGADHQGMDPVEFERLLQSGGLAWHWQAHGFHYGVGVRYAQQVNWGRVVVVNGSREHAANLKTGPVGREDVHIVHIAAEPANIANRLAQRGREAPAAIADRVARNARHDGSDADLVIPNDGELSVAGKRLADYLMGLTNRPDVASSRILREHTVGSSIAGRR
jgi:ribose 1,5-bisphosphokinase